MSEVGGRDKWFYLASASPRRRELLAGIGLRFEVLPVDIDESHHTGEDAAQMVSRLAATKARRAIAVVAQTGRPSMPVLAADTCVNLGDRILGKPLNRDEATAMLRSLSGRTHKVHTAVSLHDGVSQWQVLSTSAVTFKQLSDAEVESYCMSGEPFDKAGAYAVQGLGSAFVKHLEGSYTGVVGLPLYETRGLLANIDIDWI